MRMWFTVGTDQAVTTEITETGNSLRTIITAVSPVPFPALVYFAEGLVYPVPYVTALCHRLPFENIPIFLQAAATVTHCMQVFTKDERTVNVFLRYIRFYFVYATVHTAVNIRIIIQFGTFILHGAGLFYRFQPIISTFEVNAVASFIS